MESPLGSISIVERGRYSLDPATDPCVCVRSHSPTLRLTERHHIMPLEFGGPDQTDNWVTLCPTGHYIVHYHLLAAWLSKNSDPNTLIWKPTSHENRYLFVVAAEGYRRIKGLPWQPIPAGS